MKTTAATELAQRISRTIITTSKKNNTKPKHHHYSWNSQIEQTLHNNLNNHNLTPSLVSSIIDPFLLDHHSLALGFFNWASQQPGFTHTSSTFHSILKSLSLAQNHSHSHSLLSLLKKAHSFNFPIHPFVYRSVITTHISRNNLNQAFLIFNDVVELRLIDQIGAATCNSLLAALGSNGNDNARKVFDEMIVKGVPFSTLGFGVFVWWVCKEGDLGNVMSLLDEVGECGLEINGSVVAVIIVNGLCEIGRVSEAMMMLSELRSRGWKPDFMAYWVVAKEFRKMGNVVDEIKVLKMKRKLGVSPRSGDYKEFIFELVSEKRILEAKMIGEVIVGGNFVVEDDAFNVLIECVSDIDPVGAIVFFYYVVEKERFLSISSLNRLSMNLCRVGKVDELLEVFRVLECKSYFKDVEGYNVMVSWLCEAGRVKEGYAVLQEMKKKGLNPDVSSYNYVMEACCKQDLLRPARKLWDEMFAGGCCGNVKTYNILIRKFSEEGQVQEAQMLLNRMFDKGVEPDSSSYTFLLQGLCQEDMLEEAFELYSKAAKQDITVARDILSSFILSLCKKGHLTAASKLLCSLSHDIGRAESHVILLKCLADAGQSPIAIQHLSWVQDKSPSMLQDICTGLLASLSVSKCPEPILQFLQRMQGVF
ncbi:pentatricopeptide repeat-containing protein At5g14080 isoform X1 [Trifolium pratense]|uniref:pentatricopeptide repeat-containing protein At5g14080 isoform X1 n=1 Tax=Trifolium pratense TaxID=57577 RepID=UPI001E6957A3|nr:pentatricopeptide repeat-containing protein At5g14080 isoform X1 [Trifolium pratense]